jgi:hypothetical protein
VFMKFEQPASVTNPVSKVMLYVYSTTESDNINLHATDNAWTEDSVTWSNRPPMGELIDTAASASNQWVVFDLTDYVVSNGIYSVALDEVGNSKGALSSSEGTHAPYIVFEDDAFPLDVSEWLDTDLDGVGNNADAFPLDPTRWETDYYFTWTTNYPALGIQTALTNDLDADGLDNLAEYGLGGNPVDGADAGSIMPTTQLVSEGGTNWMEYIYRRRTDAAIRGLTYFIELTDDLTGTWSTNGSVETGTAPLETGFEAVTNQIDTEASDERFFRVKIREDF